MTTKPVNSWLQILTKLVNWISKISNKKNLFNAYKSSNLMLQSKDHEKFISSFMQNKITKVIMLTIPIIESLISASISFLGWFLEELPVRFIPTCLFLLYKQLIRYTALAVALSLSMQNPSGTDTYILLSLDTILPSKRWYRHRSFDTGWGANFERKLLISNNIHKYEKSKKQWRISYCWGQSNNFCLKYYATFNFGKAQNMCGSY